MGRRTIAGYKLTFNRSRKRNEIVCPADLADQGLRDIFVAWAEELRGKGTVPVQGQSFLRVVGVTRFNDYIVIVNTMSGKAGEEGVVYDTESGEMRFALTEKDAPTSSARAVLICPPRGDIALWFCEYSARSSGASLLLEVFKKHWSGFDTGTTFNKNRLIAAEIALKDGLVKEVEVRMVRRCDDRADGLFAREGIVSHKFRAAKGKLLDGVIIDKFLNDRSKAYELVEIKEPNHGEESRIFVSVDVGGHTRKVEIHNQDDGVYFREELNAAGEPPLNDAEIVAYCASEARIFLNRSGLDWEDSWACKG